MQSCACACANMHTFYSSCTPPTLSLSGLHEISHDKHWISYTHTNTHSLICTHKLTHHWESKVRAGDHGVWDTACRIIHTEVGHSSSYVPFVLCVLCRNNAAKLGLCTVHNNLSPPANSSLHILSAAGGRGGRDTHTHTHILDIHTWGKIRQMTTLPLTTWGSDTRFKEQQTGLGRVCTCLCVHVSSYVCPLQLPTVTEQLNSECFVLMPWACFSALYCTCVPSYRGWQPENLNINLVVYMILCHSFSS